MKKENKEKLGKVKPSLDTLFIEEIANLDFKTLRSLIKYYRDKYEEVTNEIYEDGWSEEKRDKANFFMNTLSNYEWALHYKNVMTSDDNFSTEFHNVCRKVGK